MHESAVEQLKKVHLSSRSCRLNIGPPSRHPVIEAVPAVRRFAVSIASSRLFRYETSLKTLPRADTPGISPIIHQIVAKGKKALRKDLQSIIWKRSRHGAIEKPTTEIDTAHASG